MAYFFEERHDVFLPGLFGHQLSCPGIDRCFLDTGPVPDPEFEVDIVDPKANITLFDGGFGFGDPCVAEFAFPTSAAYSGQVPFAQPYGIYIGLPPGPAEDPVFVGRCVAEPE